MNSNITLNPVAKIAKDAAIRLCSTYLKQGFEIDLHEYLNLSGSIIYYRIRLKHSDGSKQFFPMHCDDNGYYHLKEPPAFKGESKILKPLYGLPHLLQYPEAVICIVEGEKAANILNAFFEKQGLQSKYNALTSGSCTGASAADWQPLSSKTCILWPDNDESGQKYISQASEILAGLSCVLKVIDVSALNLPSGGDCVDWLDVAPRTVSDFENLPTTVPINKASVDVAEAKIVSVTLSRLLAMELPPRQNILNPWLPRAGLCMVYAERGIGKTFFALEVALAIAYGDSFLGFDAPNPRAVLYLDGEMPANTMQERLARIEHRKQPNPNMIEPRFITPDLQIDPMPNISTPEGQALIEKHIEGIDLVVVDNISTLCGCGRENEAESWIPVQQWALQLRRRGISVLFIHHAGKNGKQRGTSKREDILDTVIMLKRPSDYEPNMGACFELHFEKARGMIGDTTEAIRCQLTDGKWKSEAVETSNYLRVVDLFKAGFKQKDIADELELSKSQVSKLIKKAKKLEMISG